MKHGNQRAQDIAHTYVGSALKAKTQSLNKKTPQGGITNQIKTYMFYNTDSDINMWLVLQEEGKPTNNKLPNKSSHHSLKEQVPNRFWFTTEKTSSIIHNMPFRKIVSSQNFIIGDQPKKILFFGTNDFPHRIIQMMHNTPKVDGMVERFYKNSSRRIKHPNRVSYSVNRTTNCR